MKGESECDAFDKIHRMLRDNNLDAALRAVYDDDSDSIFPPFNCDLNHAWYIAGDVFLRLGEMEKAADAFRRSLADWPEDTEALFALAWVMSELREFAEAEKHLQRALELDPDNPATIYNLGNALFDQDKFKEAAECYRRALHFETDISNKTKTNLKLAVRGMEKPRKDSN